jgi:hypothetical protein
MAVRLFYDLQEAGWADCTVEIDEHRVTVSASYLSNALDDLSAAVMALLRGASSATAAFAEEPGESRWQFDRESQDQVRLRIFWSLHRWEDRPHDPSVPIFEATCRLRTFAGQLLAELQRLLREFGEDGYKARWIKHEFPKNRLTELQELLANAKGRPARG